MKIQELMSKPAATCHGDHTGADAARILWERDCGAVPVVDDVGRLVGVVTDRDLCMAAYTSGEPLGAIRVRSAMARETFSCRASEDVQKAEELMRDKRIRRLPVVDDAGKPIGMLSLADLARAVTERDAARRGLQCEEVARTLAAICEPHEAMASAT